MTSSHLWAPSLEPRTIINSWAYKHAIINECVSIGKEEDEYEAQVCLKAIKDRGKRLPIPGKYRIKACEDDPDRDGDEEMVQDNGLNNRNNSLNFYNNNGFSKLTLLEPKKSQSCYDGIWHVQKYELKTYVANKINYEVGLFHGGLAGEEKNQSLSKWKNKVTKIIIATNAFGMGINIPDVILIINFNFPLSLGQYIQESGRAGRSSAQAR
ncbi:5313_t:CDS:2, partial [Entrophospora sp. SA101]